LLVAGAAASARGQARVLTVERYLDYETVADPAVSPDGSQVIYTRRTIDRMKDSWEAVLWIVGADGSRNRFLARGTDPAWSPDGSRLAYVAEGEPGGRQIFVRWMDGRGGTTQVTRVTGTPANLRWSPDGMRIGFSMRVAVAPEWSVSLPAPPPGALWTEPPRLVERLHHKADRAGLVDPGYTHIFVVPATGGAARDVTPGAWSVGQSASGLPASVGWDWLRDGKSIVVDGNDDPAADRQFRVSNIYVVDIGSGARRRLTPTVGFWLGPRVAPDGKLIAYLGHPATAQTYRVPDLYTVAPDGRDRRLLSEGFDRTPAGLTWAPDGDGIYFVAEDRGTLNLHFVPRRGSPRQLTTGTHVLASPSVSRRNTAFLVRAHAHRPPDLVRVNLRRPSELTQLTDVNRDLLDGVTLGEVEEIWYRSSGGAAIQGWIVKPPDFAPERKYPLVLEVHGGPHAMYTVGFDFLWQALAASGFVVLYTNPRGSAGYGTAFGNAIDKAYPGVDYDDLMAGVDSLIGRGYVDPGRLFVGGCSGGGTLTSWIIGHTDRFRAAAVRCPITNWISGVGTSDIPLYGATLFAKPFWEDPETWLRQSPLLYVGNVKTPTLLMTGVLDLRTPIGQAEEYFTALRLRGVPTAMLRFEGEWHGTTSRPSNWLRTAVYLMAWYRRWGGW
jgi:dipeptidyl aminopeptidase/acylaminoacyl peptidase